MSYNFIVHFRVWLASVRLVVRPRRWSTRNTPNTITRSPINLRSPCSPEPTNSVTSRDYSPPTSYSIVLFSFPEGYDRFRYGSSWDHQDGRHEPPRVQPRVLHRSDHYSISDGLQQIRFAEEHDLLRSGKMGGQIPNSSMAINSLGKLGEIIL